MAKNTKTTKKILTPAVKTKWVKALRGGRYKQGRGALYNGEAYCCLGVLAKVLGARFPKRKHTYSNKRIPYLNGECVGAENSEHGYLKTSFCGMRRPAQARLAGMNDVGIGFKEIADHIETNL